MAMSIAQAAALGLPAGIATSSPSPSQSSSSSSAPFTPKITSSAPKASSSSSSPAPSAPSSSSPSRSSGGGGGGGGSSGSPQTASEMFDKKDLEGGGGGGSSGSPQTPAPILGGNPKDLAPNQHIITKNDGTYFVRTYTGGGQYIDSTSAKVGTQVSISGGAQVAASQAQSAKAYSKLATGVKPESFEKSTASKIAEMRESFTDMYNRYGTTIPAGAKEQLAQATASKIAEMRESFKDMYNRYGTTIPAGAKEQLAQARQQKAIPTSNGDFKLISQSPNKLTFKYTGEDAYTRPQPAIGLSLEEQNKLIAQGRQADIQAIYSQYNYQVPLKVIEEKYEQFRSNAPGYEKDVIRKLPTLLATGKAFIPALGGDVYLSVPEQSEEQLTSQPLSYSDFDIVEVTTPKGTERMTVFMYEKIKDTYNFDTSNLVNTSAIYPQSPKQIVSQALKSGELKIKIPSVGSGLDVSKIDIVHKQSAKPTPTSVYFGTPKQTFIPVLSAREGKTIGVSYSVLTPQGTISSIDTPESGFSTTPITIEKTKVISDVLVEAKQQKFIPALDAYSERSNEMFKAFDLPVVKEAFGALDTTSKFLSARAEQVATEQEKAYPGVAGQISGAVVKYPALFASGIAEFPKWALTSAGEGVNIATSGIASGAFYLAAKNPIVRILAPNVSQRAKDVSLKLAEQTKEGVISKGPDVAMLGLSLYSGNVIGAGSKVVKAIPAGSAKVITRLGGKGLIETGAYVISKIPAPARDVAGKAIKILGSTVEPALTGVAGYTILENPREAGKFFAPSVAEAGAKFLFAKPTAEIVGSKTVALMETQTTTPSGLISQRTTFAKEGTTPKGAQFTFESPVFENPQVVKNIGQNRPLQIGAKSGEGAFPAGKFESTGRVYTKFSETGGYSPHVTGNGFNIRLNGVSIEEAEKIISRFPKDILKPWQINEISIVETLPDSVGGRYLFYEGKIELNPRLYNEASGFKDTISNHEMTHALDLSKFGEVGKFSTKLDWLTASKWESILKNPRGNSWIKYYKIAENKAYPKYSPQPWEDFAESSRMFLKDPQALKEFSESRYKYFEKLYAGEKYQFAPFNPDLAPTLPTQPPAIKTSINWGKGAGRAIPASAAESNVAQEVLVTGKGRGELIAVEGQSRFEKAIEGFRNLLNRNADTRVASLGTAPTVRQSPAGTFSFDFRTQVFDNPRLEFTPTKQLQGVEFKTDIEGYANLFIKGQPVKSVPFKQTQYSQTGVKQVGEISAKVSRESGAIDVYRPAKVQAPERTDVALFEAQPKKFAQGPSEIPILRTYTEGTLGTKRVASYSESADLLKLRTPIGEATISTGSEYALTKGGKFAYSSQMDTAIIDVRGKPVRTFDEWGRIIENGEIVSAKPFAKDKRYKTEVPYQYDRIESGQVIFEPYTPTLSLPAKASAPHLPQGAIGKGNVWFQPVAKSFKPTPTFGGLAVPSITPPGAIGGIAVKTSSGTLQISKTVSQTKTVTPTKEATKLKAKTTTSQEPQFSAQPEYSRPSQRGQFGQPQINVRVQNPTLKLTQTYNVAVAPPQLKTLPPERIDYTTTPTMPQDFRTTMREIDTIINAKAQRKATSQIQATARTPPIVQRQATAQRIRSASGRTAPPLIPPPSKISKKKEPPYVVGTSTPMLTRKIKTRFKTQKFNMPKIGGVQSLYADLISVMGSQLKYGKATSASLVRRPGVWKYAQNVAGFVPTAEQLNSMRRKR